MITSTIHCQFTPDQIAALLLHLKSVYRGRSDKTHDALLDARAHLRDTLCREEVQMALRRLERRHRHPGLLKALLPHTEGE